MNINESTDAIRTMTAKTSDLIIKIGQFTNIIVEIISKYTKNVVICARDQGH